jgi:hypothetical protein
MGRLVMLRDVLKSLFLSITLFVFAASAQAARNDRFDPYPGFDRLTDNYSLQNRKQNYDEFEFPISINKTFKTEGQKVLIEYGYEKSDVVASHLQFKRHFESIAANLGGEIVHSGKTDHHYYAVTFKFPKGGKTAWAVVSTNDHKDIFHYRIVVIETGEAWGGAAAPVRPKQDPSVMPVRPKVDPRQTAEPPPVVVEKPQPVVAPEPAGPWNGGDWVEVRFGGCDVPNVRRSKQPVPDADYCDARMNGKVAVCNADFGCLYKNVTPKECKNGSQTGRVYVCTPN